MIKVGFVTQSRRMNERDSAQGSCTQGLMWSWIQDQTAVLSEGFKDFTEQLQEDMPEVRREAEESARAVCEKLETQQLAQQVSTSTGKLTEQVAALSSTSAAKLTEQVGRVGGSVKKISSAVGRNHGGLLTHSVDSLKKVCGEWGCHEHVCVGTAGAALFSAPVAIL